MSDDDYEEDTDFDEDDYNNDVIIEDDVNE